MLNKKRFRDIICNELDGIYLADTDVFDEEYIEIKGDDDNE